MISTTHIVTGGALGLLFERWFLFYGIEGVWWGVLVVFAVGVVSHHLLDVLPHTDTGSFRLEEDHFSMSRMELKFALFDNFFGTILVLGLFFFVEPSWWMLVGAAGANFPDVWHHTLWWRGVTRLKIFPTYYRFHEWFHWTAKGEMIPLGVFANLFFIVVGLLYILY